MSAHVEWFKNPTMVVVAPGDLDADSFGGFTNDEAAVVIGNDDLAVIEVSEDRFAAFAARLRQIADAFDPPARGVSARVVPIDGTTITSTTYCDADACMGHVHKYEYPGKRLVLTDDPALPLALIDKEDRA